MKSKFNKLGIGLILGIIAPIIAIYIFYLLTNHNMNIEDFFAHLFRYKLVSNMISIGAIANLAVFFAFIGLDFLKSARGVIFATVIYGIVMLIIKFV